MDYRDAVVARLGDEFSEIKFADVAFIKATGTFCATCIFTRFLKEEEKKAVLATLKVMLPPSVKRIELGYKRSYIDEEIAGREVKNYTEKTFPSILGKIEGATEITVSGSDVTVVIAMDDTSFKICERQGYFTGLTNHLRTHYIGDFNVIVKRSQSPPNLSLLKDKLREKQEKLTNGYSFGSEHVICLTELTYIVGMSVKDKAGYISDITGNRDDVNLCGTVSYFGVRTSKSGREYTQFTLTDFTGSIKCLYFPKDMNANSLLMTKMGDGSSVAVRGSIKSNDGGGGVTCFVRSIALCKIPQGLVVKNEYKPCKEKYDVVFPQPLEITRQTNMFDGTGIEPPACLRGKRVVVFDLETTGLDAACYSITEIGAVAIVDGEIKESFRTFVNPEMPISLEITKLTGIEDYMVKDAPKIGEVIGDFHKFCYNSVMVAHNLEFDIKFINRFAEENGYEFVGEKEDTLALARARVKGLKNYKLDTLSEFFHVNLEGHHRALNDALATAQVYIELMRL